MNRVLMAQEFHEAWNRDSICYSSSSMVLSFFLAIPFSLYLSVFDSSVVSSVHRWKILRENSQDTLEMKLMKMIDISHVCRKC